MLKSISSITMKCSPSTRALVSRYLQAQQSSFSHFSSTFSHLRTTVCPHHRLTRFSTSHPSSDQSSASTPAPSAATPRTAFLSSPRGELRVFRGVTNRSLEWSELLHVIGNGMWKSLGRSQAVHDQYGIHRDRVLRDFNSMGDYILANIFGVKTMKSLPEGKFFVKPQGGLHRPEEAMQVDELARASKIDGGGIVNTTAAPASPQAGLHTQPTAAAAATPASSPSSSVSVSLPLSLPFMLIWSKNEFPYDCDDGIHHDLLWCTSNELTESALKSEIEHRLPAKFYDVVYFVNPMEHRSIKDVFHAHVFWRVREEQYIATHGKPPYGPRATIPKILQPNIDGIGTTPSNSNNLQLGA